MVGMGHCRLPAPSPGTDQFLRRARRDISRAGDVDQIIGRIAFIDVEFFDDPVGGLREKAVPGGESGSTWVLREVENSHPLPLLMREVVELMPSSRDLRGRASESFGHLAETLQAPALAVGAMMRGRDPFERFGLRPLMLWPD